MSLMVNAASFPYRVVTSSETMVIKLQRVSESPKGFVTKQIEDPSLEF